MSTHALLYATRYAVDGGKYAPATHGWQSTHSPECESVLYIPSGHATQLPADASPQPWRYSPASHAAQSTHGVSQLPAASL